MTSRVHIISLAAIFTVVFCLGFTFFYARRQHSLASQLPGVSGKPLPPAELVDESDQVLADSQLRNGRLILVFVTPDCDACKAEAQFLRTAVAQRADIPFYGVVSFGDKDNALRDAKGEFPFKVFYDQHFKLASQLGIKRVPIKLFVENGIIKKSWGGATVQQDKQNEFLSWLKQL
jgi:peroxiredoxin